MSRWAPLTASADTAPLLLYNLLLKCTRWRLERAKPALIVANQWCDWLAALSKAGKLKFTEMTYESLLQPLQSVEINYSSVFPLMKVLQISRYHFKHTFLLRKLKYLFPYNVYFFPMLSNSNDTASRDFSFVAGQFYQTHEKHAVLSFSVKSESKAGARLGIPPACVHITQSWSSSLPT